MKSLRFKNDKEMSNPKNYQWKTLELLIDRKHGDECKKFECSVDQKHVEYYPNKRNSIYVLRQGDEPVYVGQTHWWDIFSRPQSHKNDAFYPKEFDNWVQLMLPDDIDLDLAEMHLIMKLKPRYNKFSHPKGMPMKPGIYVKLLKHYENFMRVEEKTHEQTLFKGLEDGR